MDICTNFRTGSRNYFKIFHDLNITRSWPLFWYQVKYINNPCIYRESFNKSIENTTSYVSLKKILIWPWLCICFLDLVTRLLAKFRLHIFREFVLECPISYDKFGSTARRRFSLSTKTLRGVATCIIAPLPIEGEECENVPRTMNCACIARGGTKHVCNTCYRSIPDSWPLNRMGVTWHHSSEFGISSEMGRYYLLGISSGGPSETHKVHSSLL